MKKTVLLLGIILIFTITLFGCGKFDPKLAEYNIMYRDTSNKESDGSYPTIIIKSIEKDKKDIVVNTSSPYEQMTYAIDNFITFRAYDDKGKYTDKVSIKLKEIDEQGVFYLSISDMNLEAIKYIEIGPYKNNDNNLIFKVD